MCGVTGVRHFQYVYALNKYDNDKCEYGKLQLETEIVNVVISCYGKRWNEIIFSIRGELIL